MERLAVNIVICSVTMTAAGLLYMLILRLLRNVQSAKWRYYSWILVFLGFLLPIKPFAERAAINLKADQTIVSVQVADRFYSVDTAFTEINFSYIFQAAFIIWAVGAAVHLLCSVMRQILFIRSIKRFSNPAPLYVDMMILDISDELVIWKKVKAVTVKGISTPMTVGFFKPLIILPDISFSNSSLKMILEHELVHFKRHDIFIKAFMMLVSWVHWFNPFVRLFVKTAERECEHYCDETVMSGKTGEEKRLYCQAILDSAGAAERKSGLGLKPVVSSGFFSGKAGMKCRMETILSGRKKRRLGLVCTAAAVMLTVYSSSVLAFSSFDDGFFGGNFFVAETTVTATEIAQLSQPNYTVVTYSYDNNPF